MSRRVTTALVAAVAALAAAGSISAAAAVTPRQLSLMPLPQSAFGKEGAGLEVDPVESGVVTNAEAAEDTANRKDTGASLKRLGRITGYQLLFANFGLVGKPNRLVFAASDVEVYRDGAAANAGRLRSLREQVADDPTIGFEIRSSERFRTPRIGDATDGARIVVRFGKATLWMTGVQFRRGELVASVVVMRTDASPQEARVVGLARALEARIAGVLAGRVTTPPARLGKPKDAQGRTFLPKPRVDISAAALTPADLGGARPLRQGHVADPSAVSTYQREFANVKLGSTRLTTVENGVSLLGTRAQARAAVAAVPRILKPGDPSFRAALAREFARGGGFELEGLEVLRQRSLKLGGATAYEVVVRIDVAVGSFEAAYVFVASGRFFGWLTLVSGFGSKLPEAEIARVGDRFADRLRAASKKLKAPVA